MLSRHVSLKLGTFLFALAMGVSVTHAQIDVPDVILVNGRVFTAVDAHPYAEAIAIKGTRILAVDTSQRISSMAGPQTRRIDLGGRLVIPGINDAHTHFGADLIGTKVDFGDLEPTCALVLDRLKQAVQKVPPGTLLIGTIGATAFFGPACTPAALDRIAPEDAVVLWTWTPHAAMLNQAAARKFGIHQSDPPVLGGWFGKDLKAKQWDGVVHEFAWFRILVLLMSERTGEQAKLRRFLDREAQWGVTSITLLDFEPVRRVELLAAIDPALRIRVVPYPLTEQNRRLKPEYPAVPARLSDRVAVNGVKWLLDGSPIERSCAMRAPYADDPSTSGQMDFPPEEVRAILREAQQKDTPLLLHAVGDRTTEALLNAMEATGGVDAWSRRRLRIEHGDGIMPDLIPRAKKLGVIVVENPTHFTLGELFIRRYGPERAAVFQPLHSLLEAGVPLVLASDGVVDTPILNPYLNIMLASMFPGKPKESLTREQALIAYTRTATYAEFAEDTKGTLQPGKLADLAVLSEDILKVPPQELPKTESVLTMVGGKIVYTNAALVEK